MNRPEIKVNDRVRFRTDGEIGEYNKKVINDVAIVTTYTVVDADEDNFQIGNGKRACVGRHLPIQFDICNDFSQVCVGDEVEIHSPYSPTETVVWTDGGKFRTDANHEYLCANGRFVLDGYELQALRIIKKAEKPLLANAQVGNIAKIQLKHGDIKYDLVSHVTKNKVYAGENGGISSYSEYDKIDGACTMDTRFKILSTEPFAENGSAKWSKQRMLLGDKISNEICPRAYQYIGDDGFIMLYNGKELVKTNWHIDEWLNGNDNPMSPTGWQLYTEPKPQPQPCDRCGGWKTTLNPKVSPTAITTCDKCKGTGVLPETKPRIEVGQYVAFKGMPHCIQGYNPESRKYQLINVQTLVDGWHVSEKCLTPIPAKDVIISVGCMNGSIEKHNERVFRLYYSEFEYSLIAFDALTDPMLSIVKNLLTRQDIEREEK